MKLIIGLGNPGKQYENTKHNIGFMVIDYLSKKFSIEVKKRECQSFTGKGCIGGQQVLLVKPQTFMNNSGQAIGELIRYYDTIDDFLIVYDDLDLSAGKVRFKQKGSSGGHNGIKSIISHLNSNEFSRLKIGIGHDVHHNVVAHVLSPFYGEEKELICEVISNSDEMCQYWLENGILASMNKYN